MTDLNDGDRKRLIWRYLLPALAFALVFILFYVVLEEGRPNELEYKATFSPELARVMAGGSNITEVDWYKPDQNTTLSAVVLSPKDFRDPTAFNDINLDTECAEYSECTLAILGTKDGYTYSYVESKEILPSAEMPLRLSPKDYSVEMIIDGSSLILRYTLDQGTVSETRLLALALIFFVCMFFGTMIWDVRTRKVEWSGM